MRIVCLTSNGYINCIEPFAYYWNRFAGTLRRVTVACYDVQPQNLPDNFDVLSIGEQADYSWSTGLAKLLTMIDDEVVLLMLEDYFLTFPLGWGVVEDLYRLFDYSYVVKVDLSDDRFKAAHIERGIYHTSQMIEPCPEAPYQASLQAALWRTKFLYSLLEPAENAWQFEKRATKRIQKMQQQGQHLQILGTALPPLVYANAVGGAGGKPGVIEAKHMPDWMWQECVAKGWAHG